MSRRRAFGALSQCLGLLALGCGGPGAPPDAKKDAASDVKDASVDQAPVDQASEGKPDAPKDGVCGDAPAGACFSGGPFGEGFRCDDTFSPPVCANGQWSCGATMLLDPNQCTCFSPAPPGCGLCTRAGWRCPDAGVDAVDTHADTGPDALSDASSDASCNVGCAPSSQGSFCQASEVQWACQNGPRDFKLFEANCHDPATNLQRYCCPPAFLSMCQ